ncbi:hypothetical protein FB451DRAFT_1252211 [Mycena latifolia]|nr:hypothetical protein FB451DRAFT_1252211 [Mycena latifolia]
MHPPDLTMPSISDDSESTSVLRITPDYIQFSRKIKGGPDRQKDTPVTHKYAEIQGIIGFNEFRGRGPPPSLVGETGDVFWDTNPPFVFYVRLASGWVAWNPDPSTRQPLAQHPNYPSRCRRARGVGWLTSQHLKTKYQIDVKVAHALDDETRKTLADFLLLRPPLLSKRKRDDGESVEHARRSKGWESSTQNSAPNQGVPEPAGTTPELTAQSPLMADILPAVNELSELVKNTIAKEIELKLMTANEVAELRLNSTNDEIGVELVQLRSSAHEATAAKAARDQELNETRVTLGMVREQFKRSMSGNEELKKDILGLRDQLAKSNAEMTEAAKKSNEFQVRAAESEHHLIGLRSNIDSMLAKLAGFKYVGGVLKEDN